MFWLTLSIADFDWRPFKKRDPSLRHSRFWVGGFGILNRDVEGLKLNLILHSPDKFHNKQETLGLIEDSLKEEGIFPWIIPGRKEWIIDLDGLAAYHDIIVNELKREEEKKGSNYPEGQLFKETLTNYSWFQGKVALKPIIERQLGMSLMSAYLTRVVFYIDRDCVEENRIEMAIPQEIKESLIKFHNDYPDPKKVAFLMMQFNKTPAHTNIVEVIRKAFQHHGITVLRADDKEYHPDLFPNIQTYMHGCGIGIALFERIIKEDFNPNVSLEVGYMLSMGKPICLLKDQTLPALNTDLVGKMYRQFDVQDPDDTIPPQITKWLKDHGLA